MPVSNSRRKKLLLVAGLLTAGLVGPVTIASTSANDIVGDVQHFVTCFGFMINDQPSHKQNCQPNRVIVPFESLSTPVAGGAAIVTPAAVTPAQSFL
jgi:hypothetical protein